MAEQSPMVRDFELSSRDSDSTDTRRTVTKREPTGSSGPWELLTTATLAPVPPAFPSGQTYNSLRICNFQLLPAATWASERSNA